jgi:hypothetical protein
VSEDIETAARYGSGHAWRTQPAFDEPRPNLAEVPTPTLDEMAEAPGATQTFYRVVYERVGRRGGRDGSPPPPPLTVWAMSPDSLAEHVHRDCRHYLTSRETEVVVDLEAMRGQIFAGMNNGGSFTLEVLHTAEGVEDGATSRAAAAARETEKDTRDGDQPHEGESTPAPEPAVCATGGSGGEG